MKFELVCGLETHIELSTNTKIFCSCVSKFGSEPNTTCCPVCLGLPGSLPVFNRKVIKYATMMSLVLNSRININSEMERKIYFYPDLPKAYQISQNSNPIATGGFVTLSNDRKIRINHIHIEEDAGKIIRKDDSFFIDYNRSGVPLIEIVSEPDIKNTNEVIDYIERLQIMAKDLGVSDGRMQEGSMRCDINISVKEEGVEKLGSRVEIKNMNSIKFIVAAIKSEFNRQVEILNSNGTVMQETRRFIEETSETESMREKENAENYRYFVDPDIKKIFLKKEFVESIKNEIPELFHNRLERYLNLNIPLEHARLIAKYVRISNFFDEVLKISKDVKLVLNFIIGPIFSCLETENKKEDFKTPFNSTEFGEFIGLVLKNKINNTNAKKILIRSLKSGLSLKQLCKEFIENSTEFDLHSICLKAISLNKKAAEDYKKGKEKALQALLGNVMKLTKGLADLEKAKIIINNAIKL